ncbi:hypothetical protein OG705_29190 [Streptomyces sp. NBC_00838]|uniref:hypothetical protein n=1 Tax=Streptomyces sp. NBC_00838 TaxID=2903680 RepID=UPI00386BA4AA|nr:hypothetical protein OG705_29190 [Streptomyces sp. NBC_00838]
MSCTVRKTRTDASIEKTLTFDGGPETILVRPIPTVCRTDMANNVIDPDGCGGTGWICPVCHEGDDCPTVGSDERQPGTAGAQSCVCIDEQSCNWEASSWA